MTPWKKTRRFAAGAVLISVIAFAFAATLMANSIVAPARKELGAAPDDLPVESIIIESNSGAQLATWFIDSPGAMATVVLLHPVRGHRRSMLDRARLLYESGFSIVMIDFQAHGESTGDQITFGHLEKHDAAAAIEFARRRNPDHRIGVIGRSLGGASVLLAQAEGIDALVLESVYPAIESAVHNRIEMRLGPLHHLLAPALLLQMKPRLGISTSDLRPVDFIGKLQCPVLIAGGDRDQRTTIAETQLLLEAAPEPKQLVLFEGAGHEDLLRFDPLRYSDEVLRFLVEELYSP